MKKTFAVVVMVLVLCVVGLGFYRGWFTLSSRSPHTESNQLNINLKVDPDKAKADAATLKEKATEFTGQGTDATPAPVERPEVEAKPEQ